MKARLRLLVSWLVIAVMAAACSGDNAADGDDDGNGGAGTGGSAGFGGSAALGGGAAGLSGAGAGAGGSVSLLDGGASGTTADAASAAAGCALSPAQLRVTEIDVGTTVVSNEDEAALLPLVIAPLPAGGARVAFMGDDGKVHVVTLDADDHLAGTAVSFPAHDFSALHADDGGGVILLTRDAEGGGTGNCGEPTNLCGTPPSPPIPCYDMYLMRFDGPTEKWATKLTNSSDTLPPYSTSKTGPNVFMIWWYAHHGRIALGGGDYAAYFGAAISVSQGGCINIHQGDRMQRVNKSTGAPAAGGFDWGCSHSGYERILWDEAAQKFVTVCKTDNQNRIAFAPDYTTIRPVDLAYSNLGDLVQAKGGGYWLSASDLQAGEPAGGDGRAEVHLLHFSTGAADQDVVIETDSTQNARAPHLAQYGEDHMLAAWETSTATGDLSPSDASRTFFLQARDRASGAADGAAVTATVRGNRYHDLVAFPDGSVAYVAPGSTATKLQVLRVLPCSAP